MRETEKLVGAFRVSSHPLAVYMSNAIGSSRESNPSRRICHLRAAPLAMSLTNHSQLPTLQNQVLKKAISCDGEVFPQKNSGNSFFVFEKLTINTLGSW